MRQPILTTSFNRLEIPLSQLQRQLNHDEASGRLSRDIGFMPPRRHQVPHSYTVSPQSALFIHPPLPRSPHPGKPAPKRLEDRR